MSDIIRVLPDVVANQIAAGEVIQRPASVIKELVENAVDSGADRIQVIVRDAGKNLIQVVDNGCGMSENDARLCFERHATSKIREAQDLFAIRTMGFRGEALASIASVAQVEMKTRRTEDPDGTHIRMEGSHLIFQQPAACSNGTSIAVKNIFYNIPARRRFLKSQSTELRHIITEFQRIALTQPSIRFSLHHNDAEIYNLPQAGLRERISHLMGKSIDANLVKIQTETSIVNISGFIGKPEKAKKSYGEQFFFVNGRFMKHSYLHKAVIKSYESLLPAEAVPSYFIYLDTDPSHIDINIHPTKTEIKFDDERAVFQILQASVKEGLGKFNITPSLDFNQDNAIEIPVLNPNIIPHQPEIRINPDYNPFDTNSTGRSRSENRAYRPDPLPGWEQLYSQKQVDETIEPQNSIPTGSIIQMKGKYLLTQVKSGLLLVHLRRALERISYETFLSRNSERKAGQKLLYPEHLEVNPSVMALLNELRGELEPMGFELEFFGGNSIIVHALPPDLAVHNIQQLMEELLNAFQSETQSSEGLLREKLARSLARVTSFIGKTPLNEDEMRNIIDRIFLCKEPHTTPGGKKTMSILQAEDIDRLFK